MAGGADHEGLTSPFDHEFGPPWPWLPRFAEVGELADVVDFHHAGVLAQARSGTGT
jgi:hypothetical protein